MKNLILFLTLSLSFSAFADSSLICSLMNLNRVKAIAVSHSKFDKNRHCSVSCMLAVKCSAAEVMTVGILKEIQDMFGSGTADIEDLKADAFGIDLVLTGRARRDKECLKECDLYYRK